MCDCCSAGLLASVYLPLWHAGSSGFISTRFYLCDAWSTPRFHRRRTACLASNCLRRCGYEGHLDGSVGSVRISRRPELTSTFPFTFPFTFPCPLHLFPLFLSSRRQHPDQHVPPGRPALPVRLPGAHAGGAAGAHRVRHQAGEKQRAVAGWGGAGGFIAEPRELVPSSGGVFEDTLYTQY